MKVLIVSPHFPPVNAADMQRVRMLLPHFQQSGCEAEVIAVKPQYIAGNKDPWLNAGVPTSLAVYRTDAMSLKWGRIPGLGLIATRAMRGLRRAGDKLIGSGKFDLVYFSTTQFGVHRLGPYWKNKFGIPFVMDYQDPWVNDYYREHPNIVPPGGRIKYAIIDWLNRFHEPRVLRQCSGITSVSSAYPEQLRQRYAFLKPNWPVLVAPFPGDDTDLTRVKNDPSVVQSIFDPNDGKQHWVYVGRGGEDMHRAVRAIFAATRGQIDQCHATHPKIQMHFIGTSYAANGAGKNSIEPLAAEFGLQNIVSECTDRIPYSMTLRCLLDAHALIVPGSDDPGYTASKIYPYLLAHKPMLVVFHEQSSVIDLIRKVKGAVAVPFSNHESHEAIAERIAASWLLSSQCNQLISLDDVAFKPFTAKAQAETVVQFFRKSLKNVAN